MKKVILHHHQVQCYA